MSQRRMFSPDIVQSEEFITMPISSQALYFHLGMNADDDGFIQPKITMRILGANDDDLKVLLAKRFLLSFDHGVVVIKHWLIHNMIRADRYKETRFKKEKKQLFIKENKAYTDKNIPGCQIGNQPVPQVRLGKVRLGKVNIYITDELKNKYPPSMITDFTLYWDETDSKGVPRWKKEKTWDLEKRLARWKRNQEKWDYEKNQKFLIKKMSM